MHLFKKYPVLAQFLKIVMTWSWLNITFDWVWIKGLSFCPETTTSLYQTFTIVVPLWDCFVLPMKNEQFQIANQCFPNIRFRGPWFLFMFKLYLTSYFPCFLRVTSLFVTWKFFLLKEIIELDIMNYHKICICWFINCFIDCDIFDNSFVATSLIIYLLQLHW